MNKLQKIVLIIIALMFAFTLSGCFHSENYTIRFESNQGSEVPSLQTDGKSTITLPNEPLREGYDFLGWYYDDETFQKPFLEDSFLTEPITSNLTVYARWIQDDAYVQVSFMTNSEEQVETQNIVEGAYAIEPPTLFREGYLFAGWYTSLDLGETFHEQWSFEGDEVQVSMTLYAKWNIQQYTIVFEVNGGNEMDSITMDYDLEINILEEPSKEGHTFDGWYLDSQFEQAFAFTKMPAEDLTLFAQWIINTFTLEFVGSEGTVLSTETFEYGADLTGVEKPIALKTGYTFTGWDSMLPLKMPSNNVRLQALFDINQYTLSFEVGGESEIPSISMDYDKEILFPDEPSKEGHLFVGWYLDSSYENAFTLWKMPAEDTTLYAKWDPFIDVEIEFNLNGGDWTSNVFRFFESEVSITATTRNDTTGLSYTILDTSATTYRWFYKVFIVYDTYYDAYRIVAVDAATANIESLNLPVYDFVLAVHDTSLDSAALNTIKAYAQSSLSVGKLIVFDQNIEEFLEGAVESSFYSPLSLNLSYKATFLEGELLPVPVRKFHKFIGWSDGELLYLELPGYTESMDTHNLVYIALWEGPSAEDFSEYMSDLIGDEINRDIALPKTLGEWSIVWESSDETVIDTNGVFYRPYQKTKILLTANLISSSETITIPFEVDVVGYKSLDQAIASSYIYRNFSTVTDSFFETLDIINCAFIGANSQGTLSGTTFLYNVSTYIFPKAKEHGNWVIFSVSPGAQWSTIAGSASIRNTFADNIVAMINQYGFDGVDIDWEYPSTEEKENFTLLMEAVYQKVKANNPNHLVTAAIAGGRWQPPRYDLVNSAQYIDYINMMTYGMTSNEGYYQNALFPSSSFHLPSMNAGRTLVSCSIEESIAIYQNDFGVPKSKIIVGVAFYGIKQVRSYNSTTSSWSSWARSGSVYYHSIAAQYLTNPGYTVYYDSVSEVPFIVKNDGTEFISYDDPRSIVAKSNYILENGLAGMMYWEHGTDSTGDLLAAMRTGLNK